MPLASMVDNFPQITGAPVTQLPGPITKVMATIAHGIWSHFGKNSIA
jgi:hypothetical protein